MTPAKRWNEAVPQKSSESLQAGLLRGGDKTETAIGCPIASQQRGKIPATPERGAQQGKEPDEAMIPIMQEGQKAQEHIDQQRRPHLPAHGIGAVTQEIGQLESLFDLL